MKYEITFKNQYKALEFLFFLLAVYTCCFLYYEYTNRLTNDLLLVILFFVLITLIPVLYLHIEYYYYNNGTSLEVSTFEKKAIIFTDKSGIAETFDFDDLTLIKIYMSPSWHRGSTFQLFPTEPYHYARIYTKNGKKIIITSLMAQRVQHAIRGIKGVPIEKEKRLFASIYFE